MRLVDLSVTIENTPSEPMKMKRKRITHKKGAKKIARRAHYMQEKKTTKKVVNIIKFFLGCKKMRNTDFPDGEFITNDTITMSTHMGTHMDAPIHFGSECEGKPSHSIDELPIDYFYGQGVKLDLRHKKSKELIEVRDIKKALESIEHNICEGDIVLIWTAIDKLWGTKNYFVNAPGMSKEATKYLVERGVRVIGIDSYGFDRPFGIMLQEFLKTGDNNVLWPSHFYGREKEYVHIERLTNLDSIPSKGFNICCFPLKIKDADASWCRVIAMIDD